MAPMDAEGEAFSGLLEDPQAPGGAGLLAGERRWVPARSSDHELRATFACGPQPSIPGRRRWQAHPNGQSIAP